MMHARDNPGGKLSKKTIKAVDRWASGLTGDGVSSRDDRDVSVTDQPSSATRTFQGAEKFIDDAPLLAEKTMASE